MLYYIFGGIFVVALLCIAFSMYCKYLMYGGDVFLKEFKNTKIFEYEFKDFKAKKKSLYNRQSLDLIFNDNSKVHIYGGIEDKSIIPLMSVVLKVDEDDIQAGSQHKSIELHQFVKNFEVQSIENIEILDKHNNPVKYFVSKGVKFDGNKQHMTISLDNEKWENIKSIKFESTTEIDISMFYNYYAC